MAKGDTPPKPKPRPPVVHPDPGTGPQDDPCAEPLVVGVIVSSAIEIGTQVLASVRGDQVVAVTAQGDLGPIEGQPAAWIIDCSRRRWVFPGTVDAVGDGLVTITLIPRFRT
jgi:hypothetical protein